MRGIKRTAADRRFSRLVRERDNWTCQRCGTRYPEGASGLDCAHMFSRRCSPCTSGSKKPHICTRLEPDNAVALCTGCHMHIDSHPAQKIEFFERRLGHERMAELSAIAHGKRNRMSA